MRKIDIKTLACDLDGVAYDTRGFIEKRAIPYFQKRKIEEMDSKKFDVQDIFNCSREERNKFWYKNIWEYAWLSRVNDDFKKMLNKWKREGIRIPIVTARAHATKENWEGPT